MLDTAIAIVGAPRSIFAMERMDGISSNAVIGARGVRARGLSVVASVARRREARYAGLVALRSAPRALDYRYDSRPFFVRSRTDR
jgi:hypothetical protein